MTRVEAKAPESQSTRVWVGRLAPLLAFVSSGFVRAGLEAIHVREAAVFSCLLYLFIAAGVAWQALHPRSVVDRFRAWALFFVVGALVGFLPGTSLDMTDLAGVAMVVGIPIGVVLTAWRQEEAKTNA